MKKILIPTDFSDNAANATNYGIALFDDVDTVFVLIHALYIPTSSSDVNLNYYDVSSQNTEKYFIEEKKRIKDQFPNLKASIETHVEIGSIVDTANSFIHKENIDYIVMGTKGASGLREVFVGSRASSMIKNINIPMFVIPEDAKFVAPKKILFTTNMELQDEDINIDVLLELAKKYNSRVNALYVSKTSENINVESAFIKFDLDVKLSDVKHELDINIDIDNKPSEAIDTYSKENNIDLIAMISTKGSLFHELFHSSVTKKVAMHTEVPLLIMHTKI